MAKVYSLERPADLNDAGHDDMIAAAIARASMKGPGLMEATRKATFHLNPAQKKHITTIERSGRIIAEQAWAEVYSAYYIGLELAVAAASTEHESNGRNIYGSDGGTGWMQGLDGHEVTRDNFEHFVLPGLKEGHTLNGVGAKQLTSLSLVLAAEARGGAWNRQHNAAVGDLFMLELIHQTGSLWAAAYHYNGSGPAAEHYASLFVGQVASWRALGLP